MALIPNRSSIALYTCLLVVGVIAPVMSLHAAPPTIVSTDPLVSDWVVDGSALEGVTITFDGEVIVPNGAVSVRTVDAGAVLSLDVSPLAVPTQVVNVTFEPIRNNRVTLVVDYSVINGDGEPLDGEVDDPRNAFLPTGDGEPGGQAVFQFSVLQGDVNRDGVVDSVDLSQLNAAATNYRANADLNSDGVVDQADQAILLANAGASIPKTDKTPPFVLSVSPSTVPLLTGSLIITFSEAVNAATLSARSVHVIGANGQMLSGTDAPIRINDARYEFPFDNIVCAQNYDVKISAAIADISGELLAPGPMRTLMGSDEMPPTLDCPEPVFVNSTDPFAVAVSAIESDAAIQSFLRGAVSIDDCTASAEIVMFTSLDVPSEPLPLGVNTVLFSAVDDAGNLATCEGSLIVVPAVPLEGPTGPIGLPGADGTDGLNGDDGLAGIPGIACWDLDGDRVADEEEDINADGTVDVLDCRGTTGDTGEPGEPGTPGGDGSDGNGGDPPAGDPVSGRRLCGAVGMINPLLMLFGLTGLRIFPRRVV